MSVGAVGAVRVEQPKGNPLPGVLVGGAVATGVAAATMKGLSFPVPVAAVAGLAIGGPIAAVSLLNNTGEPNKLWQSLAVGAAPLAVIGGALGAFGGAWSPGKGAVAGGAVAGALMFGAAGALIGGVTHAVTKPG